jgi:hypothetical protein
LTLALAPALSPGERVMLSTLLKNLIAFVAIAGLPTFARRRADDHTTFIKSGSGEGFSLSCIAP